MDTELKRLLINEGFVAEEGFDAAVSELPDHYIEENVLPAVQTKRSLEKQRDERVKAQAHFRRSVESARTAYRRIAYAAGAEGVRLPPDDFRNNMNKKKIPFWRSRQKGEFTKKEIEKLIALHAEVRAFERNCGEGSQTLLMAKDLDTVFGGFIEGRGTDPSALEAEITALNQRVQSNLKQEQQERVEKKAYESRRKGTPYIKGKPLVREAICVVHATHRLPKTLPDGSIEIDTKATTDKGGFGRNSVHVALNHKVASHAAGAWDRTPYTIIGDFNQVVKENGVPECLYSTDTWWVLGLDEPLRIPQAMIVKPDDIDAMFQLSLTEVKYKTRNFSLGQIKETFKSGDQYLDAHNCFEWIANVDPLIGKYPQGMELKEALTIEFGFTPEKCQEIEALVCVSNNRLSIDKGMDFLGYKPMSANKDVWRCDELFAVNKSTLLLAQEMGIKHVGLHTDTAEHDYNIAVECMITNGRKRNYVCPKDVQSLGGYDVNPKTRARWAPLLASEGISSCTVCRYIPDEIVQDLTQAGVEVTKICPTNHAHQFNLQFDHGICVTGNCGGAYNSSTLSFRVKKGADCPPSRCGHSCQTAQLVH